MSEVLFEVTEDKLETGLRGYPVGYCTTSTVDPKKGLFYADHPLSDLEEWEPEEVIYLLFHGEKGSLKEVNSLKKELKQRASCAQELLQQISLLPRSAHPMKLFSAALLLAGGLEGKNSYSEDALNLVAKIPQLTAAVINHHAGWQPPPPPDPFLGYVENFTHMLQVPLADKTKLHSAFQLFNVLHYDHGGGNLSAFVGKAVASGMEDLYGSIAAAMCALAGPRHGRANQESLQFLLSLQAEIGPHPTAEAIEQALRGKLERMELIIGFGHAVLRVEDPRATLLYSVLEKEYSHEPLVQLALLLRSSGSKVLKENSRISNPYPNVDAVSGLLLYLSGFPYPDYFTLLFGMARVVGISRQIVYERQEARNGKGTPIVRPKYLFKHLIS